MTGRSVAVLARLGEAAARHRWSVLLAWVLLAGGLGGAAAWSVAATGDRAPAVAPTPASAAALALLDERIPGAGDPTGWVVLVAPEQTTIDADRFTRAIDGLVAGLPAAPGVSAVVDPATGGTVSADRRIAVVPVAVAPDDGADPADRARSAVDALAGPARAAGLQVELGGALAAPEASSGTATVVASAAGVVLTGLIAWLVLGTVLDAIVVVGTALAGSVVGTAGVLLVAGPSAPSGSGTWLAFLVGLAVGGPGAVIAVGRGPAGADAVVRGGLLVVAATAGLAVTGIDGLATVGLSAAVVAGIAILAVLTLAPALAALVGRSAQPRLFTGGGRRATGRPARAALAAVAALALLTVPAWVLVRMSPEPHPSPDRAESLLASAFGAGAAAPLLLTVAVDRPEAMAGAMGDVVRAAQAVDGVSLAASGRVSGDGTLGVVTVLPTTGPADPGTRDLVHRLRERQLGRDGVVVEVTGRAAVAVDVADALIGAIPRYLGVAAVIEAVLLLLLVRPWPVALVAGLGAALSVGAALLLTRAIGALTGWPGGWGWTPGFEAMVPVLAASMLLAMVVNQAVVNQAVVNQAVVSQAVVSRSVRPAPGRSERPRARVVWGCAAMVAAVFAATVAGPNEVIAAVAAAVVIGVLLDAGAVRLLLVPAALTLVSRTKATEPASAAARPTPPAGAHTARGVHSSEPDQQGRGVVEAAVAASEHRPGGRHRGD